MSDQHGYGEKESLGEESRSVDSESAGRSHMDFFSEHPDDVAARGRALVDDKPLVQADVLTSEQSNVPAPGQSSVPSFYVHRGLVGMFHENTYNICDIIFTYSLLTYK